MGKKSKKSGNGGSGGAKQKSSATSNPPKEKNDIVDKKEAIGGQVKNDTADEGNSTGEEGSGSKGDKGEKGEKGENGELGKVSEGRKEIEEEGKEEGGEGGEEEGREEGVEGGGEEEEGKDKVVVDQVADNVTPVDNVIDYEQDQPAHHLIDQTRDRVQDSQPLQSTESHPLSNGTSTGASTEISSLQSTISSLNTTISSNNHEISQLKLQLEEQNNKILSLSSSTDTIESLQNELLEATAAKENAEQQYESLLDKISHIKSTLGARLKSDAEELSAYKEQINELTNEKRSLNNSIQTLQQEAINANKESDHLSHELSQLRNEFQTKMQEYSRERESLTKEKRLLEAKFEKSESMIRDLEIAIADDHSLKETDNFRISGLEEQITTQTNYAERYRMERDELTTKLRDIQNQLENKSLQFTEKLTFLETENQNIQTKLDSTTKELVTSKEKITILTEDNRRLSSLEEEVKEKVLLIGKLRHEAVILNEHLTKALRMIKKDSEGETVDKLLITNLLLSFLSFPRGDAKKFEVLQLISNCLGWDEEQKAQAGLARQHHSQNNTSVPLQSSNNSSHLEEPSAGRFMGLFAEFLERESSKRNASSSSSHT